MDDFEGFYRAHLRMVYGLALSRTGDAFLSEDLTQETFLRAWQNASLLATLAAPAQRAWLVTTVRNLAAENWRKSERQPRSNSAVEAQSSDAVNSELRLDLLRALATLEPLDRELVTLSYLEELTSAEVGALLQLPPGTVRRRLWRCRKLLAKELAAWSPRLRDNDEADTD